MSDVAGATSSEAQDRSQGQAALERLLAVRSRLLTARGQLQGALSAIGGKGGAGAQAGAPVREEKQFFPALDALITELDGIAGDFERDVADLRRRF